MTKFTSPQNWYTLELPAGWFGEADPDDESGTTSIFYRNDDNNALRITALQVSGTDKQGNEFDAAAWIQKTKAKESDASLQMHGDTQFVAYTKTSSEHGETITSFHWDTASGNIILLCSYATSESKPHKDVGQMLESIKF